MRGLGPTPQGKTADGRNAPSMTRYTSDTSLTASPDHLIITNAGATGLVTLTLPAATIGQTLDFVVVAPHEFRIDPNGAELFNGETAGKYKSSSTTADQLRLTCTSTGEWQWTAIGTWATET